MRKDKRELMRAQTLIENDRISAGDNFIELLKADVDKLLKDYFDFSDSVNVNINKSGDNFKVDLSIIVKRIKAFEYIPKN